MPKILGGDTIALFTILVLWPELPDTLPGKPLYRHFLLIAFPFNFNISAKAPHSILCARAKVICTYDKQSGGAVALAYKFPNCPRQRRREVPVLCGIF